MANPLSYQQVLALSKGLNFFFLDEDGRSTPITFNPIDSKILLSENGILLREKTQDLDVVLREPAIKFGQTSFRLGNPPKVNGEYLPGYAIKKCNDNTINNIFKFNYYDYFGDPDFFNRSSTEQGFFFNTEDGSLAPEAWMQVEQNYINNDHIVDVFAFTDPNTNNKPFNTDGTVNSSWDNTVNCASILALGNPELATVSDGFFAHIIGGGDNFIFQKANGTLDALGSRNAECDSFIFDPFNGPVFPSGRLNNLGDDYEDVKPANYESRIESMAPYGLWEQNSVLPNPFVSLFDEYLFEGSPIQAELFRFVDADIYTNVFQRCSDSFSIDFVYPKFPYSKIAGSEQEKFNQLGGLDGALVILKNTTTEYWEQSLAGTIAVSGQGGIFVDNRSANPTYLNQLSEKNQDISIGFTAAGGRTASLYDLVDTHRRAAPTPAGTFGSVKPITCFKTPYFDFNNFLVKGVTKQRIAAGFFSSFFIDSSNKIDAPQTVYSNLDNPGFLVNITNLVRNVYSTREMKHKNKGLVDLTSSNTIDLAFANGSFGSAVNAALAGEDIKKVSGYQNEVAWITKAGLVKYAGFNSNMNNVFTLDEEALDVALNKNTNTNARRFAVKLNPSGVITVADGVAGPSAIGDLVSGTPVAGSKGSFVSVDAGFDHAIALRADGAAFAWGSNTNGQTATPSGIFFKSVKAHGNFSCGIDNNDVFRAWGSVSGSVERAIDYWVGPNYVVVKVKNLLFQFSYATFGNVPVFVSNFLNSLTNQSNISSAAFTNSYCIISDANLKTNYISSAGSTSAITNLPSTSSFQDVYFMHGAENYSLVVGEKNLIAPIKEIYSKDLDDDGVDESPVITYESIDLQGDLSFATLDSNGTVRYLYIDGLVANNTDVQLNYWSYFGANEITNYLVGADGNFYSGQNEGFVSVKCSGGYGGTPTVLWCLHESGSLFGAEIRTAVRKNKFDIVEKISPQDPDFGKNINNRILQGKDAYPNTFQTPTSGGSRNFIKTMLNKIPTDSNGIRFPVVEIFGGYASLGGCVCVNTKYTGSTSELIPYQEPEIVLFINNKFGGSRELENIILRLQKRLVTIDPNGTGTATYTNNPKFSQDFYNKVFGIVVSDKGNQELIYTTPRTVSIARSVFASASANDFSNLFPSICIHGNNGNVTFLSHKRNFCNFSSPLNIATFNNDLTANGFVSCSCSFTSNLTHGIFNTGGSTSTLSGRYFKPQFLPDGFDPFEETTSDPFTGVVGGSGSSIVIPGLSFDNSPSGFQQFYIDNSLVGKSGGDFNLDSEVNIVEKQLHYTGTKILKKLK